MDEAGVASLEDGDTMALLKRFDTLEVATADLTDAVKTYRENFGFELKAGSDAGSATLNVGGAAIAATGEGLAGLWLEAEDVGQVAAALRSAGLEAPAPQIDRGRRVLALDPKIANQVPLFIFDRKI